jgi:hypothetical protein
VRWVRFRVFHAPLRRVKRGVVFLLPFNANPYGLVRYGIFRRTLL